LTNPTSSDSLSSPSHSAQHANVNDAVEALQAKVGINSSAVTSSLDYKVAQLEASTLGVVGYASSTNTSAYSAGTPISVLSVSATIVPGRVYRLGGKLCCQASTGNTGLKTLYVSASGMTTVQLAAYTFASGANLPFYLDGQAIKTATDIGVTSGSGTSVTFTLYFRDSNNNGGLNTNPDAIVGANTFPQYLWVEDIGVA
jgi:hypothetical protein